MKQVSAADFTRIIESYVVLESSGTHLIGHCPACHAAQKRMVVKPEAGQWHCYKCGAGGDLIDFVMNAEEVEWAEAQACIEQILAVLSRTAPEAPSRQASLPQAPEAAPGPVPVLRPVQDEGAPPAAPCGAEVPAVPEPPPAPESDALPGPEQDRTALAAPASEVDAAVPAESFEPLFERLSQGKGFRGVALQAGATVAGRALPLPVQELGSHLRGMLDAAHSLLGAPAAGGNALELVAISDAASRLLLLRCVLPGGQPCHVAILTDRGASVAMYELAVRSGLASLALPGA